LSVIGIDLGTSAAKAGLFSSEGRFLSLRARRVERPVRDSPLALGSDPEAWTRAALSLLRELAAVASESCPDDPLTAFCVGGNGPTLIAVGQDGLPAMPALPWADRRAQAEADEVSRAAGRRVDAAFYLPKALWIMRQLPGLFARVRHFMPCPEYVAFRLSGIPHTVLPAPGYEPFIYGPGLIQALGLPGELFPDLIPPGQVLGRVLEGAAKDCGLPHDCAVVTGLPDFLSALIGSGLSRPGMALDRAGSSEALNLCAPRPHPDERLLSLPHPVKGMHNISGGVSTSGTAMEWLQSLLCSRGPSDQGDSQVMLEAGAIAPGSEGLIFLPYLSGERAPLWDPGARGAFMGLSIRHRRGHMMRALLESVAYALREVRDMMLAGGSAVDEIRLSGGPARNELWNHIKADILGSPLRVPDVTDAEVRGSAAAALTGIGRYASIQEASAALPGEWEEIEPDPQAAAIYDEGFHLFLEARSRLATLNDRFASLSTGGRP